ASRAAARGRTTTTAGPSGRCRPAAERSGAPQKVPRSPAAPGPTNGVTVSPVRGAGALLGRRATPTKPTTSPAPAKAKLTLETLASVFAVPMSPCSPVPQTFCTQLPLISDTLESVIEPVITPTIAPRPATPKPVPMRIVGVLVGAAAGGGGGGVAGGSSGAIVTSGGTRTGGGTGSSAGG